MKKFNFSKKHKNANSDLDNRANNRKKIFNKINKMEIKPQFLVIGLVAIITVISRNKATIFSNRFSSNNNSNKPNIFHIFKI